MAGGMDCIFSGSEFSISEPELRRATWGCFPICPEMSRFVPVCPLLSPFRAQKGQKRTNGDKTGHFGTNLETPPFSIYPHLALLN